MPSDSKETFLWENPRVDSSIQKRILHLFTKQINSRSFRSWCIKGTKESLPRVDSLVSLMHYDPSDQINKLYK